MATLTPKRTRFCGLTVNAQQHDEITVFFNKSTFSDKSSLVRTALLSYIANNKSNGNNGSTKERIDNISKPKDQKWFEHDFREFKDRVIRLEDQIASLI